MVPTGKLRGKAGRNRAGEILETISSSFGFLIRDFGFQIIKETDDYHNMAVVHYRNQYVQVECAGSESYFHLEIRRLLDGDPAGYEDEDNSIGFESLAVLESKGEYDHFAYCAGGSSNGLEEVLANTIDLLKRNSYVYATNIWIDIAELRNLEDRQFEERFGFAHDRDRESFIQVFERCSEEPLRGKGFSKVVDSIQLAPYDPKRRLRHLEYSDGRNVLRVSQEDWRDDPDVYSVEYNGELRVTVRFSEFPDLETAARVLTDEIERIGIDDG